jgi:putative YhbY family RNA-binding protein
MVIMSQNQNSAVAQPMPSAQRAYLRSQAHDLKPVVMVGDSGLTPNVIKEIDLALTAHSLIKVRVFGDDRQTRVDILSSICDTLHCQAVQHIGKLLVLWRETEEKSSNDAPERAPRKSFSAARSTVSRGSQFNNARQGFGTDVRNDRGQGDRLRGGNRTTSPRQARINMNDELNERTRPTTRTSKALPERAPGKRSFGDSIQKGRPSRTSSSRSVHPLLAPPRKKRQASAKKRALG